MSFPGFVVVAADVDRFWVDSWMAALAVAARHLVPEDRPVWAQIAPGNASSLRAFLAAGYEPVGSEVLFTPPSA
jgi:hypothetical protein